MPKIGSLLTAPGIGFSLHLLELLVLLISCIKQLVFICMCTSLSLLAIHI